MNKTKKRVLLLIMDGFGYAPASEDNAIALADNPTWEGLLQKYPHALLQTSGPYVGLPEGVMGNSEVGHLNIGGGRVISQDVVRITRLARQEGFDSLPDIQRVLRAPGALHLLGLVSDGCVHSDLEHLQLLIEMLARYPNKPVFIHAISDGRDTAPQSGKGFLSTVESWIAPYPHIKLASVVGRYYAMDRDKRWERVTQAYRLLTQNPEENSTAPIFATGVEAVAAAYAAGETDEFITPRYIQGGARIQAEDQVIFFNFRADRARQISRAMALPGFSEFAVPRQVAPENWLCFTMYDAVFPFPVLFAPQEHRNVLGEVLATAGCRQLRVAETEKYAHVTYYLNGGREEPWSGEDRVLIPSPKDVATYDEKPEMSVFAVTDAVLAGIEKKYDFVAVNFANGDMVGHTGDLAAAIAAVEAMDKCLARLVPAALAEDYEVLITADHGNCEQMRNSATGEPFTQHTTNPVYFVWVGQGSPGRSIQNGQLSDIAPTVLNLLHMPIPNEMTGHCLIQPDA